MIVNIEVTEFNDDGYSDITLHNVNRLKLFNNIMDILQVLEDTGTTELLDTNDLIFIAKAIRQREDMQL